MSRSVDSEEHSTEPTGSTGTDGGQAGFRPPIPSTPQCGGHPQGSRMKCRRSLLPPGTPPVRAARCATLVFIPRQVASRGGQPGAGSFMQYAAQSYQGPPTQPAASTPQMEVRPRAGWLLAYEVGVEHKQGCASQALRRPGRDCIGSLDLELIDHVINLLEVHNFGLARSLLMLVLPLDHIFL